MLTRARNAFQMSRFADATALAMAAFDFAASADDSKGAALMKSFEPTLARIFLHELGSPSHTLFPIPSAASGELPLSPHTAFLLSRLGPGMRVADAFDVAFMPRLETLRCLLALVTCGAVHLEHRADEHPSVAESSFVGALAHTIVVHPFR